MPKPGYEKTTKLVIRGILDVNENIITAEIDGVVSDLGGLLKDFHDKDIELTVSVVETGGGFSD